MKISYLLDYNGLAHSFYCDILLTRITMQKYDGHLIHESYDDEGIIEIVEQKGVRSLHFGSQAKQSNNLCQESIQPNLLVLQDAPGHR